MAASTLLVQLDLSGTAFGGAFNPTDVTRFVSLGAGITVTSWRQDAQAQMSPSTWSITFDNSDIPGDATAPNGGRFTPGLSTSPWTGKILPGVRCRITETVNGTAYQLADGYAIDWSAQYDENGTFTTVVANFQDILGWMGTFQLLRAMVVEEMLLDAPSALYPLDDASGSSSAGDISSNVNPAATVLTGKRGVTSKAAYAFGATMPIVGLAGGLTLTNPDTDVTPSNARAYYLSVPNALPSSGVGWSLVVAFIGPTAAPVNFDESLLYVPPTGDGVDGQVSLHISAGGNVMTLTAEGNQTVTSTIFGAVNVCDGKLHVVVITLSADGKTLTMITDGGAPQTSVLGVSVGPIQSLYPITIGADVSQPGGRANFPFSGTFALIGQYKTVLSTARAQAYYPAAATALAGERTDQRISRLLSYRANNGSVLDVGKGLAGIQTTTGVTLQQALLDVAKAEGGVVYADGQGRIVFLNRGHLRNPASSATFDAEADLETNYVARIDLQQLLNDVTISRATGSTQRKTDAASITANGVRALSDTYVVNGDRDAADAAGWLVANFKTPKMRSPQIVIDVLTLSSLTQAQAALARGPLDRISLTNLPTSAPPTDVMIQGRSVTIALDRFDVQFFTSQLPRTTLRADAAASAFTKLDNGLVIAW